MVPKMKWFYHMLLLPSSNVALRIAIDTCVKFLLGCSLYS